MIVLVTCAVHTHASIISKEREREGRCHPPNHNEDGTLLPSVNVPVVGTTSNSDYGMQKDSGEKIFQY